MEKKSSPNRSFQFNISSHFKLTIVIIFICLIVFKILNVTRFPGEMVIPDSVLLGSALAFCIYLWVQEIRDRDKLFRMNVELIGLRDKIKTTEMLLYEKIENTLEQKHPHLRGHARHVSLLSKEIGKKMNMTHQELEILSAAALLHDIGMMSVPDSIIQKPQALDDLEWVEIKKHPVSSFNFFSPLKHFGAESRIVRQHHERFDGKGYPGQLKGKSIELGARIIAVADAFDAMNSQRIYRGTMLPRKFIVRELRANVGTQFDPQIITAFLQVLNEQPFLWDQNLQPA
ncbi:MAG: HD domain-containing protein [Chitinivibrionales bacterium]|nr:HD domain-containing protein [Chitinivibrionales bacterium]